jgi:3-hydroxymyristoyl/3-hydroxydecanoyl-(acyl carrier protein) dehydratase
MVAQDDAVRRQLDGLTQACVGFPRVLSVVSEPSLTRIAFAVPDDLCWFGGHFPDKPILPGIVQLHWAVLACRVLYGLSGSPKEIKRLKFRRMVEPPAEIELAVTRLSSREAQFSFSSQGQRNSEGTMVFPEAQ